MPFILDCTLRDGGYYTNWDFDSQLVDTYIESINQLPIDYVEIGYRSKRMPGYFGKYFYLPVKVLEKIRRECNKKLVIILNEKDVRAEDVDELLDPCVGIIDLVRIAIDPKNFRRSIELAKAIKNKGFGVGINLMYMSNWKQSPELVDQFENVNGVADFFYMVDSYGGVYPEDVREVYAMVKSKINAPIGFHGHNNLELSLINTLTAIECGVDIVDATMTGMGRGAGNLKTELLLTALNSKQQLGFDFNALSKVVDGFSNLQKQYEWGTNLPYMVSGANSLPQKKVMDWVGKRYYSFNSIIRALENESKGRKDNEKLAPFEADKKYNKAMIVGGGKSAKVHSEAIKSFLASDPDIVIIHASSKNAREFVELKNDQIFCLVGNEGYRMEDAFAGYLPSNTRCVLPPYPRKMGTYVPKALKGMAFELKEIDFSEKYKDSHTGLALQTIIQLQVNQIYVTGYDGYAETDMGPKEQALHNENEVLFSLARNYTSEDMISLTPSRYSELKQASIYSLI